MRNRLIVCAAGCIIFSLAIVVAINLNNRNANVSKLSSSSNIFSTVISVESNVSSDDSINRVDSKSSSYFSEVSSTVSKCSSMVDKQKTVYLTFDDGPTEFTPKIIDILDENNVKATFFIAFMSKDTPEKRACVKREFEDGNVIGVHSWTHKYDYIYANEQNFLTDFNKMEDIIVSITGVKPNICRFPGGISNTVSLAASHGQVIMPKLVADVEAMGFIPFDWTVGGQDALKPYPTKDQLVQDIVNGSKGAKNVIILMHDTHQVTLDALPLIIKQFRDSGYAFETLSPSSPIVQQHYAKLKIPAKLSKK